MKKLNYKTYNLKSESLKPRSNFVLSYPASVDLKGVTSTIPSAHKDTTIFSPVNHRETRPSEDVVDATFKRCVKELQSRDLDRIDEDDKKIESIVHDTVRVKIKPLGDYYVMHHSK